MRLIEAVGRQEGPVRNLDGRALVTPRTNCNEESLDGVPVPHTMHISISALNAYTYENACIV